MSRRFSLRRKPPAENAAPANPPAADVDVPDANPDLIERLERLHWPPPAPEVRERVLARVLDAAGEPAAAGSRTEQPK